MEQKSFITLDPEQRSCLRDKWEKNSEDIKVSMASIFASSSLRTGNNKLECFVVAKTNYHLGYFMFLLFKSP
jgi:hypothetical protein